MTRKIFRSTVLVAVIVLMCSLSVVLGVLFNHFTQVQVQQLKNELGLAITGTELYGNGFLENVEAKRFRITWISADGTVLFDTKADQTVMENHADREEIREAFTTGFGSAVRTSKTLTEQTFYEAQKLKDGTVLRISTNQKSAWSLMIGMIWPIVLISALAMGLSAVLARRMAKKIVEPLNQLDLEQPLKSDTYEEISPLLNRIHWQHRQITEQMETLRHKAEEFQQIISHMQEGLVLLDDKGVILSINSAAMQLFAAEAEYMGKDFLQIACDDAMGAALADALDSGHGYTRMARKGRDYQFDLSRIQSDGVVIGVVVLAFDITDRLNSEQMRREFTANVSHELKTPLQGIIGSAELLESGMVKPEDEARFLGHIRKEASRMVSLVEDVIHLSQLDEGVALPGEDVSLMELAEEVVAVLAPSAATKEIRMTLTGVDICVHGVRRLLHEMLYNLCDNAIKYNVPGGEVQIRLQGKTLTVEDTGVGIPPEHQGRVFERFYRVDKSHSRQSGGNGLGLSIVKHAAAYHKAVLELQSTPGAGTRITVTF